MLHETFSKLNFKNSFLFKAKMGDLETRQRTILKEILKFNRKTVSFDEIGLSSSLSYEDFKKKTPVSNYKDWKVAILKQKNDKVDIVTREVKRYQGTSGSSDAIKWIPYNSKFLKELDQASSAWIVDLGKSYPKTLKGKHYWSLSWVPDHLRECTDNDDQKILPYWKRTIMSLMMVGDKSFSYTQTNDECLFATLVSLVLCEKLSLLSVWSPTFALNLVDLLIEKKDLILKCNEEASWNAFSKNMKNIKFPKPRGNISFLEGLNESNIAETLKKLWPNLALISCWNTSTSREFAERLKEYFPNVPLQGKGIWTTEGVITIPWEGKYPLAYLSHFYEFECLSSGNVFPSWNLKKGMRVAPIITTGNGIYRYKIEDVLIVSDYIKEVPCFKFEGRMNTIDMVGEKIDTSVALEISKELKGVCLFGIKKIDGPYYLLLVEDNGQDLKELGEVLEASLLKSFHYRLARELNQLGPAKVLAVKNPEKMYLKAMELSSLITGNIKMECLKLISNNKVIEMFEKAAYV